MSRRNRSPRSKIWKLEQLEGREVPALTLSVLPPAVSEAAGANAALGTVTRDGDLTQPLTVTLSSSDATEATVPASVTIPANQTKVTFAISAVDDLLADGPQPVTITAAATPAGGGPVQFDPTFGTGGLADTSLQSILQFPHAAIARLPNGQILAASEETGTSWQITRLNADGTIDTTFGTNGVVSTTIFSARSTNPVPHVIALQPDGKFLVGGNLAAGTGQAILGRYNPDGSLDGSYGLIATDALSSLTAWVTDIAVRPDGRVLLGLQENGSVLGRVAQLTTTGALDSSFGTGGIATLNATFNLGTGAEQVELLEDGTFLAAGAFQANAKVARVAANGRSLVTAFGTNGIAALNFGGGFVGLTELLRDSQGRIVYAGGHSAGGAAQSNFAVGRLTPAGQPDAAFAGDGTAIMTLPDGGNETATGVVLTPDDKVVLGGVSIVGGVFDSALARFNADGTQDGTFDGDGFFRQSLVNTFSADIIYDLALQPDGKLLALTGWATDVRVARFAAGSKVESATALLGVLDDEPAAQSLDFATPEDTSLVAALAATDLDNDPLTYAVVTPPANGVVVITDPATGAFTYRPNPNFAGKDSFTYKVNDGGGDSNVATVTIGVTAVNDAPTAALFQFGTPEDTPLVNFLKGADVDGDPITYSVVAPPANGTVTITNAATGAFTYTPTANFTGTVSFTYKVNDGQLDSNVATIFVTVSAVNDAPTAADDGYAVNEDAILTITAPGVLGNDTDVENNPLTAVLVTAPTNGTLTLNANGSFTYRPRFNFNGTDSFTYQAKEALVGAPGLLSNVATVTITVNAVNDPPFPTPIVTEVTTAEDTPLSGQLAARDPENDAFTFALDIAPPNGTVAVNPDGTWTYTPNANFFGTDQFVFRVTDTLGASSQGGVVITVTPANDAPTAANDAFAVDEDGTLSLTVAPVTRLRMVSEPGDFIGQGLTYDFDPTTALFQARPNFDNGVSLSVDPPAPGSFWFLDFAAPNEALLTPGTYLDAMRFPFQAPGKPGLSVSGDGRGSNTLTGRFVVYDVTRSADGTQILSFAAAFVQNSEGNPPALVGWSMFNTTFGAGGGVLANDTDVEGDLLLGATLVTGPTNGTLAFRGDGTFDYTPNPNFNGTDTFTYRTNDGRADSNVATVTITVRSVNDAPTATELALGTPEDTPVAVPLAGADVDGDPLTFAVVTPPSFGTVTFGPTGAATYTPNANFNGSDSFAYTASDGTVASAPATVRIDVAAVNDAPTAGGDSYATNEDTPLTAAAPGVLGNDADVDGDALAAAVLAGPANGTLALAADGSFAYTPNANFNGTDGFTYTVGDGKGGSAVGAVTIRVNAVNDAPTALDAAASTDEDTPFDGTLLGVDVDGDALQYALVGGPAKGALMLNADGTYRYTPGPNFNGTDSFTFRANDGAADSNVGTVTITVRAVNDLPVAAALDLSTDEDTAVGGTMTAVDVDGDPLTYAVVTPPAKGNLAFDPATGAFTYTPNANYNGADSFTFRANDGTANGPTAAVSLTVRPVADAPVVTPATFTIPETAANGSAVGTVVATDADGGGLTLAIVGGNAGGAFAVTNAGAITVANAAALDFETQPVFTLTVRATDPTGLTGEAVVTVRLTDVNENARVTIDIEPEDRRNRINLRSGEAISVAIFSTADFDARTVDVASLRFGRTGQENSLLRDRHGRIKFDLKDVNGDGRLDLVVRFEADMTGFRVGDTRGYLTGRLTDGTAFSADDAVSVTRDRG
jgi:uncharacterized delta-60 repeat protein